MNITCYVCGIEPIRSFETTTFSDPEPTYLHNWPGGDHEHAEKPPTPAQLAQAGHDSLRRILEQA